jgi:MraZ protein
MISHAIPSRVGSSRFHPIAWDDQGTQGDAGAPAMPLFIDTFVNRIDRKGRVSVPASFRAALAGQPVQGIVAFPTWKHPALQCGGIDWMQRLSDGVNDLDAFSDQQDALGNIFSDSKLLAYDDDGRIVLPGDLIAHAQLTDSAAFVGRGPIFEIWEPEAHRQRNAEARRRAMETGLTLKLPRGDGQ